MRFEEPFVGWGQANEATLPATGFILNNQITRKDNEHGSTRTSNF
jgi:hypothetical protein